MLAVWWSCPGPAAWIANVVSQLDAGRSVVLVRPSIGAADVAAEVRRRWRDYEWSVLDPESLRGRAPAEILIERFAPGLPPSTPVTPAVFATSAKGRLIALTTPSGEWEIWRTFLNDFGVAARQLAPYERPLLLVDSLAADVRPSFVDDVALASALCRGAVEPEDMALYAAALLRDVATPNHERRLRSGVVAELAIWDPETAANLAKLPPELLLNPTAVLREIASERSWATDLHEDQERAWAEGALQMIEGVPRLHSAYCALVGDEKEIRRRIWSGQVSTLFPLIERLRIRIVELLDGRLGDSNELLELEIAELYRRLDALPRNRRDPELFRATQRLKEMRDRLAHREPVDLRYIRDPAVTGLIRAQA